MVQGFALFDNATEALLTNCETVELLLAAYAQGQLSSPLVNDLYRTATYVVACPLLFSTYIRGGH